MRPSLPLRYLNLALVCLMTTAVHAAVNDVQPRACQPGQTTRLTLSGKGLNAGLRVATNHPGASLEIESAEAERATVVLTLSDDAPLGPLGLWTATADGMPAPLVVMVDDLPAESDSGVNHTLESAQPLEHLAAVSGVGEGDRSDHYKLTLAAGQRVAVEVLCQPLSSPMDPLVRVLAADGTVVHRADDDPVGPDCRFSFTTAEAGQYILEVRDSRYAPGGRYHLRVGDFPVLEHAYPLAVQSGKPTTVRFATRDGVSAVDASVRYDTGPVATTVNVATRRADGASSAWVPLRVSPRSQFVEPAEGAASADTATPLSVPVGISGRLSEAGQSDRFAIQGQKGRAVRFQSRTRSLRSSAALQMRLRSAAGEVVAETAVDNSDEWRFDYTFAEDAVYELEVSDLLQRGGPSVGYWIDVLPAGSFEIALKADAKTAEKFWLEPTNGGCAIDLQISRFGYDGPIEVRWPDPPPGLRLVNPRIAAKATEAKLFIAADETYTPDRLTLVSLWAHRPDDPARATQITSTALARVKTPHVPFPAAYHDGVIQLAGVAGREPYVTLEAEPLKLARPVDRFTASFSLKRLKPAFKAPVTILADDLPAGWQLELKAEADKYDAVFTRDAAQRQDVAELPLLVFSQFQNRGRIDRVSVPVQWFDPLALEIDAPDDWIAGRTYPVTLRVIREGGSPQPVTIAWTDLPAGLTAPESVTVAADQDRVTVDVTVAPEADSNAALVLRAEASSKFDGVDIRVDGQSSKVNLAALPQQIQVHPAEIAFGDARDRQQILVTGVDADGAVRDWTHQVTIQSANPDVAEALGAVVRPGADGETEIVVTLGPHRRVIPVRVADLASRRRVDFESEVLVALSKQGCNSGACHGSPSGKGMFRLSLRAFDVELDRLTLIREEFGRRINRIEPEQSLLLLKPTMKVAHGGGKQLRADDPAYEILKTWIAEGAEADPPETPRCVRLEVLPGEKRVLALGDRQQLSVTAHFADGSSRDVTHLAAYESSDTTVATVTADGRVDSHARGDAAILVRFLEHIESVPLMFVEQIPGFQWAAPQPANYIDEQVYAKLRQLQYLPSQRCSDAEFLRRVYLDVTGLLPTVEESRAFLSDPAEGKRAALIDRLLERDEYAKFWALKWGDLLRMTSKQIGEQGVYKYHRWVERSLRENQPYDQFAADLLTASGSTLANPPANFYRAASDMNESVESISQVFLGARLQCAKCHNHPFERWTQDNYYGLGAFFNRVQRRRTQRPGEMFVYTSSSGEVTQPRTGQQMRPWLPQRGSVDVPGDADRRDVFVDWLVDPENPYFARMEANRIWSQLFARGIVDPIDDFRDSNPPSNAPLLEALAADFASHGFDRKHLIRTILNSQTYQASSQANEFNRQDTIYFSHQTPRLLTAEQLLDALNHFTGTTQKLGKLPAEMRATQLPAPDVVKVDFLKAFGQPERSTVCACERTDQSNLGMVIELFNGATVHARLSDPNNRFRRALDAGKSLEQVLDELYYAAFCRPPSDAERDAALAHCRAAGDPATGLEDVCWALLNTDEFLFQH
ncbi:DUF1549 domain-containing protein [Roseimaritima sediminicola]|uniref:DUF1549 domain-containing protein n=1 Tax=Roseimaritima sediminicola TaxID=2662066 RepID=UPI0012984CF5|nr:DUF1549 domain-containing protein [Roseimaritima sediminicola]